MLKTRETDLAQLDSATYREVRDNPAIRTVSSPQFTFVDLQINVTKPGLSDARVRRAIAYASIGPRSSRKTLSARPRSPTRTLRHSPGLTRATSSTIPTIRPRPRALLDAAGWKPGSDGIRVKDGKRLTLELAEAAGGTTGHNEDVQIQQMLAAVGIEVTIKAFRPSLIFAPASQGGVLPSGNFDLSISGWSSSADPDNSPLFTCSQVAPAGQNVSRYCNPALDADERVALGSYDLAVRKRAYAKIERILSEDLPMVFLYYPKARFGMNPALQGFSPNGVTVTWNAYLWSL